MLRMRRDDHGADTPVDLDIRTATAGDAEALARLSTDLGYPSTGAQVVARLSEILGRPDHLVAVAADREGGAVAFIQATIRHTVDNDPTGEIVALVVDERHRGRATGRALVEAAERWAASAGMRTMTVRSRVQRERAHRFYERRDYRHLKDQKVFRKDLSRSGGG